jgi:hypothetical protein
LTPSRRAGREKPEVQHPVGHLAAEALSAASSRQSASARGRFSTRTFKSSKAFKERWISLEKLTRTRIEVYSANRTRTMPPGAWHPFPPGSNSRNGKKTVRTWPATARILAQRRQGREDDHVRSGAAVPSAATPPTPEGPPGVDDPGVVKAVLAPYRSPRDLHAPFGEAPNGCLRIPARTARL